MWRRIGFSLLLVTASVALTSAFFLLYQEEPLETKQPTPVARGAAAIAPKTVIRLHFASRDAEGLTEELREIEAQERLLDQMAHTLIELSKGPQGDALPVIPEGTRINALHLDEGGTAYVDFSSELVNNHPGGTCAEELTVYAIADTLAVNYPRVVAVQLLVDGVEIETLAGHLDMRHPILPDFSIVNTVR